jgi:hypothetical protein
LLLSEYLLIKRKMMTLGGDFIVVGLMSFGVGPFPEAARNGLPVKFDLLAEVKINLSSLSIILYISADIL